MADINQARTNDAIIITRTRAASAASFIGASALLIGLVALVYQGGVSLPIGIILAVGVVALVFWAVVAPRDFIGVVTGRGARYGTIAVFSTLVLLGVVALVYVLLARANIALDMTESGTYSLTEPTRDVLRRVTRPMQITGFYTARSLPSREIDDQFFSLYTAETNGLIGRQYYDPEEVPALAQQFQVIEDGQVYLSYLNADGSIDFSSLARVPLGPGTQERDMTSAIQRLLIAGTLTVYFEISHGSRDLFDATGDGISGISAGIQESGLLVETLDLQTLAAQNADVPANASTVIFSRPLTDLTQDEVAVLDRYLQNGGALFIMTDVNASSDAFLREGGAFSDYLWTNYGIRALDAVIVDPLSSAQTPLDVIGASIYTGTDISARLDPAANPLVFRLARALQVNLDDEPPPDVSNGQVVLSSEGSYAERDISTLLTTNTYDFDEGVDTFGPQASVVWATNIVTNARIVIVGDSDFASNGLIGQSLGNALLFTDSVSWLSGLNERITYPAQMSQTNLPLIFVARDTLDTLAFLTIILLPGVVLVTGVSLWLRRARR